MESVKIRVKLGMIEVDYEGSEAFFKSELESVLNTISGYSKQLPIVPEDIKKNVVPIHGIDKIVGTVTTIATKLSVNGGPELVKAACAKLHFVDGMDSYTRKQIGDEIQAAKSFYNINHSKNLSTILTGLIKKGDLNEIATDTYSLTSRAIAELQAALSEVAA